MSEDDKAIDAMTNEGGPDTCGCGMNSAEDAAACLRPVRETDRVREYDPRSLQMWVDGVLVTGIAPDTMITVVGEDGPIPLVEVTCAELPEHPFEIAALIASIAASSGVDDDHIVVYPDIAADLYGLDVSSLEAVEAWPPNVRRGLNLAVGTWCAIAEIAGTHSRAIDAETSAYLEESVEDVPTDLRELAIMLLDISTSATEEEADVYAHAEDLGLEEHGAQAADLAVRAMIEVDIEHRLKWPDLEAEAANLLRSGWACPCDEMEDPL